MKDGGTTVEEVDTPAEDAESPFEDADTLSAQATNEESTTYADKSPIVLINKALLKPSMSDDRKNDASASTIQHTPDATKDSIASEGASTAPQNADRQSKATAKIGQTPSPSGHRTESQRAKR